MSFIRTLRPLLVPASFSLCASLALAACMMAPAAAPCACPAGGPGTAGGPSVAPGEPAPAGNGGRPALCASGVGVFDDESFQGRGASLGPGRHDLEQLEAAGIENDTIRSVCVAAGCSVTLYHDYRFGGPSIVVSADSPVLPPEFNGGTSSLVVTCN